MCGENYPVGTFAKDMIGSPPRVWGKLIGVVNSFIVHRITPTCVGKTGLNSYLLQTSSDHPHVCGENIPLENPFFQPTGSPPRVWGKLGEIIAIRENLRITPTCVGKTIGRDNRTQARAGSPPRVWGKLSPNGTLYACGRITPTCVGKTTHEVTWATTD